MSDDDQVLYNGKWHEKIHFRKWLYNERGERKLANNWWEYDVLKQGNVWHDEKPRPKTKVLKPKKESHNGADSS